MTKSIPWYLPLILLHVLFISSCSEGSPEGMPAPMGSSAPAPTVEIIEREARIPVNAVKILPETDEHPPVLHSDEYENPLPVPGEVNTAGAEDSPFISPDGNLLYFFFTPDVTIPVEKQLLDEVTGIYVSEKQGDAWGRPKRIILQDPGKLSLDGCEFVLGNVMWFCTAREGYSGLHWFTADYVDGTWQNWQNADFDPGYQVGELHMTSDGMELYFGSDRPGGMGALDIWVSNKEGNTWGEPVNLGVVNTADSEGWPAISPDGYDLWFYRNYSVWRSKKVDGAWQAPELIVSSLAGEPSIDAAGNLYFVHHYYSGDRMLEADIYVAYRKSRLP